MRIVALRQLSLSPTQKITVRLQRRGNAFAVDQSSAKQLKNGFAAQLCPAHLIPSNTNRKKAPESAAVSCPPTQAQNTKNCAAANSAAVSCTLGSIKYKLQKTRLQRAAVSCSRHRAKRKSARSASPTPTRSCVLLAPSSQEKTRQKFERVLRLFKLSALACPCSLSGLSTNQRKLVVGKRQAQLSFQISQQKNAHRLTCSPALLLSWPPGLLLSREFCQKRLVSAGGFPRRCQSAKSISCCQSSSVWSCWPLR